MQLATGSSSTKRLHTIKAASIYSDRGQHSAAARIKCGPDWRSNSISGRRHKEEEKKKGPCHQAGWLRCCPSNRLGFFAKMN